VGGLSRKQGMRAAVIQCMDACMLSQRGLQEGECLLCSLALIASVAVHG
jgi:hypothetical protein